MKIRYPLALSAAIAAAGVAAAQPVQVQIQRVQVRPALVDPVPSLPATPTDKPEETKPAVAADPNPKSLVVPEQELKQAKELANQLGHPSYPVREKASRELAKMGRMALPAIQEALGSNEPEVVQRAEALLPRAEADDMKARVACFLADVGGKFTHTLPGWDQFKLVAGNDASSRKLFAEMLKSSVTHQMLLVVDKGLEEANSVLSQYVTRVWEAQNGFARRGGFGGGNGGQAKLGDLVAALFVEGQFSDKDLMIQASIPFGWGNNGAQSAANYVYNVPEVSNAMYTGSGEYGAPIRKIILQWMDTRTTAANANQAYQFAQNMFANDPKKKLKYAARVLESEGGQNSGYNKQNVLQNLANQPDLLRPLVPAIAKCFDDTHLLWNWQSGNPGFDIQLRDYALAYAIQLTDQKPEDYGMSRTSGQGTGKAFGFNAFYFKDDTPPKNGPGGAVLVRPGRGVPIEPVEPKKGDKKDEKKEEGNKLSQDDRRKAAVKKWNEWVQANIGIGEKEPAEDARKKWEAWAATPPKKTEPKKEEPKKEEPKKEEPKK